ncbi:MAG: hypothetical protein V4641_05630 [Pseudomonadota bacterium]
MSDTNPTFIKNLDGRQPRAVAHVSLSLADFVGRNNVIDLQVPNDAEVLAAHMVVTTAFDTTGTDTLAIGSVGSAARYMAATTLKATGLTAGVPTGYQHTTTDNVVRLTRVPADTAATVGTVIVTIEYVDLGNAKWTQG